MQITNNFLLNNRIKLKENLSSCRSQYNNTPSITFSANLLKTSEITPFKSKFNILLNHIFKQNKDLGYKEINIDNWAGKDVYKTFLKFKDPFISISTRVDISNLPELSRKKGTALNVLVLHALAKTANEIPQFKLRIKYGLFSKKLVQFDEMGLGLPVPVKGKPGALNFVNIYPQKDLDEFIKVTKQKIHEAERRDGIFDPSGKDNVIYLSYVPVDFSSIHNVKYNPTRDSTPRINWGKPTKENGATTIPIFLEAHHSLATGFHAGKFLETFQKNCKNLE